MPGPKSRDAKTPTRRRRPVQDRSKETFAAILEAAAQILVRDGHEKTTTNAIAERAGISVGTLYHYFPNKRAILDALTNQFVGNATTKFLMWRQQSIEERAARKEPSNVSEIEERARFLFGSAIRLLRENAALARALLDELPSANRAKLMLRVEERIFQALPFAKSVPMDRLRETEPKRYEVTISLWITMCFAAITRVGLDKPTDENDALVLDGLVRAFVAMIAMQHNERSAAANGAPPLSA